MTTSDTPHHRAMATAARQHGALSTAQAGAAGLSPHQVLHLEATGRWRRAVRGVYVVAGTPDSWLQRAWVASLATGGVLSHATAGAVLGLCPPSFLPHVTVAPRSSARCPIAKVHRSALDGRDTVVRDGLRVTAPSRLLVDLAAVLARPDLESLVDDALCSRVASPRSVLRAAERVGRGRRGLTSLRRAIAVWTPGIEPGSVAEVRLLRLLGELGVHGLVAQHDVVDDGGFVARLDLADVEHRRGLEYDGLRHHGPRAWERDESRHARLRALGWDVRSVTKADLLPGERGLRAIVDAWRNRVQQSPARA